MVNNDQPERKHGPGARHRIFCMMGKSGSGKDTLYRELFKDGALPFERLVPCTTRPIRAGEKNGREYHFYTVEEFRALESAGKIIESRCYRTVHGPWYYFTADDGQIDLTRSSTLLIGTPQSYLALRQYFDTRFGEGSVLPVYVEVEDGERLQRALDRERAEEQPKYQEMCRRFLADCEVIRRAGYTPIACSLYEIPHYWFEFAVLKRHAEPILSEVPKFCEEYTEAHRLLKFLQYFVPVPENEIPPTSLLREFVGGSSFHY